MFSTGLSTAVYDETAREGTVAGTESSALAVPSPQLCMQMWTGVWDGGPWDLGDVQNSRLSWGNSGIRRQAQSGGPGRQPVDNSSEDRLGPAEPRCRTGGRPVLDRGWNRADAAQADDVRIRVVSSVTWL